jgi:hypothetical protein
MVGHGKAKIKLKISESSQIISSLIKVTLQTPHSNQHALQVQLVKYLLE